MNQTSSSRWARWSLLAGWLFLILGAPSASAVQVDAGLGYPLAAGMAGQNFNPNLGLSGTVRLPSMIEPWISNWVSVEYYSLTLRTDTNASFRIIPILAGVSLPGKVTDEVTSEFGLGLGAAIGYLNSPGTVAYRSFGYFATQFRGGVSVDLGSGFSVFSRIPVTIIVGAKPMTYLSFVAGAGYQF